VSKDVSAPKDTSAAKHAGALRGARLMGYTGLAIFMGTLGVWSATANISGAVIGMGQFVAEGNLRKVQHQTGGVVAQLLVREGSRVAEGELVIRLDETLPRANLLVITRQIDELTARGARLEAERDGASSVSVPSLFQRRSDEQELKDLITSEIRLFQARAAARDGIRSQLTKRIGQLNAEIDGLKQQRHAKQREAQMIQRELIGVRDLFRQNLVQITRLSQLEREAASLEGQQGQLTASIAQSEGRIAEIELQIIQLTEDLRAEAMRDLRDIQGRLAELNERRIAAEDQLRRIDIRAPAAGVVHQLAVHTVGGVITPAEPAMLIVPGNDKVTLEARVAPQDIDQLQVGQPASVRLHAFNQRTTPELIGTVAQIGADAVRDQQTGMSFFVIRLNLPETQLERIAPLKIVNGMQADVFIQTVDRTPLSYFLRPVKDQFAKAFRER
jgi:HlyD family secretion protein